MKIPDILLAIGVAMFGGFSGFLMDENHNWFDLIVAIVTAGFAGFLTFHLCKEFEYSQNLTSILCGVAGLSGRSILILVKKYTIKYLNKKGEKL